MAPKTMNGVSPIFITGATQQLFECVVDEQVTRAAPHKLIAKQAILDDMIKRAAVSDFAPFKQQFQVSNRRCHCSCAAYRILPGDQHV
jgi:hypothetical protein